MSAVTLGMVLQPFDQPEQLYEAARQTERLGYHSVWVTDRTLAAWPWLDHWAVLGGVAALTKTIKVGTCMTVIARRNPVLTASFMASIDYLTGGRLIFGTGVGGLEPKEYAISNTPLQARGAITNDYIRLLRRLWSEDGVTFDGKYYQCADVTIQPKPPQGSRLPIWVSMEGPLGRQGRPEEAQLRRAGHLADGWLPTFLAPGEYAERWQRVEDYAQQAGREPGAIVPGIYAFAGIGRTSEAARAVLAPAVEAIFNAPFQYFEPVCLVGTPDHWLEQIDSFARAGARHVNVLLYTKDILGDIQMIGEEVLPKLGSQTRQEVTA